MKAQVWIEGADGCWFAYVKIRHDFISEHWCTIATVDHKSKGQLKRKVIQFCGELNLEVEFI